MKKMFSLFAAFAALTLLSFHAAEDIYDVNTKASNVHWIGKKTGGQHEGDVPVKSGQLKMNGTVPVSGEFVLDMQGITCTDIADKDDNKSLVDHLKGEDFFGSAKYPNAIITIKKFENAATGYTATADLTIKGVKNEIQFPAKVEAKDGVVNATADITIDRTKWNIVYKSKSILGGVADKFIYDDVPFSVKLVLNKRK